MAIFKSPLFPNTFSKGPGSQDRSFNDSVRTGLRLPSRNPYPEAISVSPNFGTRHGSVRVTVTGRNFLPGAKVLFGTARASDVIWVSSTEITCLTPANSVEVQPITVVNPDGKSSSTAGNVPAAFTYTSEFATPTITSITPSHGILAGNTAITDLHGTNFGVDVQVYFDGIIATNIVRVSSVKLTCNAPAHAAGVTDVVVVNLQDGQTTGNTGAGLFTYDPRPQISSIAPSTGFGVGSTPITDLHGSNFVNGAQVYFDGNIATGITFVSSVKLTCTTPAGVGVVDVLVVNPDTQDSGTSGNGLFTYVAAPVITSITPDHGGTGGGTAITDLHGTGFVNGATVTFDGIAATSVVWVSSVKITCVTPVRSAGAKDVVVTNPDTQNSGASGAGIYTFVAPFNPTTLALSSYQRNYASSPWLGTATAGNSGLYKEAQSGSPPSVSTTLLNGHAGAEYKRSSVATETQLIADNSAVVAETLVTNSAYTVSFLVDILSPGAPGTPPYFSTRLLGADAHWGWLLECPASLASQVALTFNAAAQTITRANGTWIGEGFVNGQTVYIRRTVSNNGFVSAVVSNVTATVLTFAGGNIVNESTLLGDDVCISAGPYTFRVFNYIGGGAAFPSVSRTITPGVHWIYVRRTSSGIIQIDIDGVAGSPQALTDHLGASGVGMRTNIYSGPQMSFILYERFTSLVSQSDANRDNYKSYLNLTYGTAY